MLKGEEKINKVDDEGRHEALCGYGVVVPMEGSNEAKNKTRTDKSLDQGPWMQQIPETMEEPVLWKEPYGKITSSNDLLQTSVSVTSFPRSCLKCPLY